MSPQSAAQLTLRENPDCDMSFAEIKIRITRQAEDHRVGICDAAAEDTSMTAGRTTGCSADAGRQQNPLRALQKVSHGRTGWHSHRKTANAREKLARPTRGNGPMKFRPLHDRVVVRRLEGEEKTKGGIIIPDTAKEKPQEGEIIAVGPGARDEAGKLVPLDVRVGDRILFGKWSGTEVKIDGEDLLIMKESDVMGVVEGRASSTRKAA
jgi:chaperonin GroES